MDMAGAVAGAVAALLACVASFYVLIVSCFGSLSLAGGEHCHAIGASDVDYVLS